MRPGTGAKRRTTPRAGGRCARGSRGRRALGAHYKDVGSETHVHSVAPMSPERVDDREEISVRSLGPIVASRLLGNTFIRFPYVLLSTLAAGLGISVSAATAILGVRELGGLATPLAGRLADRGHERTTMVTAAALCGACCIGIAAGGGVAVFAVLMLVSGAMKISADTAQSAWVSHRIPFSRRARAMGILETSWPLAFLLGVPVCALVTDRWGWRAPFLGLGLGMFVTAGWVWLRTPADHPEHHDQRTARWRPPARARPLLAYAALQPFAQMLLFSVAGAWFADDLGFDITGLGLTAVAIGSAELIGTAIPTVTGDRLGVRRMAIAGMLVAVPASACLVLVDGSRWWGLGLVVLAGVGFEMSFVAALPMITEVDPDARASMVGTVFATATLSRAVSSAVAGILFTAGGIGATGFVTAGVGLGAIWSLQRVRNHR